MILCTYVSISALSVLLQVYKNTLSSNFRLMAVLYCLEESYENCCIFFNILVEWLVLNSFLVPFTRLGILPKKESMKWNKSETLTQYCLFLKDLKASSFLFQNPPDVTFLSFCMFLAGWLWKTATWERNLDSHIVCRKKNPRSVLSCYSKQQFSRIFFCVFVPKKVLFFLSLCLHSSLPIHTTIQYW